MAACAREQHDSTAAFAAYSDAVQAAEAIQKVASTSTSFHGKVDGFQSASDRQRQHDTLAYVTASTYQALRTLFL